MKTWIKYLKVRHLLSEGLIKINRFNHEGLAEVKSKPIGELLTIQDLSQLTNYSYGYISRLTQRDLIPYYKIGSTTVFIRSQVIPWYNNRRKNGKRKEVLSE